MDYLRHFTASELSPFPDWREDGEAKDKAGTVNVEQRSCPFIWDRNGSGVSLASLYSNSHVDSGRSRNV